MSDLPSVNGMVKTVGSVPPASWAANVVAFHSYSFGWILICGFCASKILTWALNVSNAAFSLPGFSETTLSVTSPFLSAPFFFDELHAANELTASTPARAATSACGIFIGRSPLR